MNTPPPEGCSDSLIANRLPWPDRESQDQSALTPLYALDPTSSPGGCLRKPGTYSADWLSMIAWHIALRLVRLPVRVEIVPVRR